LGGDPGVGVGVRLPTFPFPEDEVDGDVMVGLVDDVNVKLVVNDDSTEDPGKVIVTATVVDSSAVELEEEVEVLEMVELELVVVLSIVLRNEVAWHT